MGDDRLVLVYDGECDFCGRLATWVARHDRRGRLVVKPNQEIGLVEQLGLSREEVDRASWVMGPGGQKLEGAAGISRVLRELGGFWGWLGAIYRVPPIAWVEDRYYRRVARRRGWW